MNDIEELTALAVRVVREVMEEGAKTHRPGEWRRQTADTHCEHLDAHAHNARIERFPHDVELRSADLKSAVVRSLMAIAKHEEESR